MRVTSFQSSSLGLAVFTQLVGLLIYPASYCAQISSAHASGALRVHSTAASPGTRDVRPVSNSIEQREGSLQILNFASGQGSSKESIKMARANRSILIFSRK